LGFSCLIGVDSWLQFFGLVRSNHEKTEKTRNKSKTEKAIFLKLKLYHLLPSLDIEAFARVILVLPRHANDKPQRAVFGIYEG